MPPLRLGLWRLRLAVSSLVRCIAERMPPRLRVEILRQEERLQQRVYNRLVSRYRYREYITNQINTSAWSRRHPLARAGTEKSVRRFIDCLDAGSMVLDAGCGDGYGLDLLRAEGYAPIGVDISLDKLSDARHHGNRRIMQGDLHHIPISPDCVDAIHCSHVLEHMLDARGVLAELKRVLRPHGRILFVLPLGPANYKHPTAFLDERDVRRMIGAYFPIGDLQVGEGRGGQEVWVLTTSSAEERHRG